MPADGNCRSTFYDKPAAQADTAIVEAIAAICEEFEFYGWRRVRAELRHRGMIVNHKKVRRLMREHDLQPRQRRRYVATTDSDHDQPIDPNRAKGLAIDGPDQIWVADITYVAVVEGFAYVAGHHLADSCRSLVEAAMLVCMQQPRTPLSAPTRIRSVAVNSRTSTLRVSYPQTVSGGRP